MKKRVIGLSLLLLATTFSAPCSTNMTYAASRGPFPDSTLPVDGQKQLQKAMSAMKSKNWSKAKEAVTAAASAATDCKGCLYIVEHLDKFGGQANKVKRPAVEKALGLAKTNDEFMAVARRARECEMYDLSKETLDKLVAATNSFSDLMEIAHGAHEGAMSDLTHLALHKAYTQVNNEPDALEFIRQSNNLGIEDLARKAAKELIEDQTTATELVALANKFEAFKMPEQIRNSLKRALEKATTVSDFLAIFNSAKHFEEADIVRVAQYKGRKLTIINKIKNENDSTPAAIADQERKTKEEQVRSNLAKPSGF